jgi:hypothetical protein
MNTNANGAFALQLTTAARARVGVYHIRMRVAGAVAPQARQSGTLLVLWGIGHKERWVLLTGLAPRAFQHS